jgi:hypothetical protein
MLGGMRALIFIALTLLASAPAAAVERRFPVTDFTRIEVDGPYQVRVVTGRSTSAVANGPQAGLDRLTIEVAGQTLRIRRNRTGWSGTPGAQQGQVTIAVTTRILNGARLIGPGRLELTGLTGLRATLGVEGAGEMIANGIATDVLAVRLVGSGQLTAAGRTATLNAVFEGSGNVNASGLIAQDVTVVSTTFGSVALHASRTARVTANGRGEVVVAGRASCTLLGANTDMVRCGSQQR